MRPTPFALALLAAVQAAPAWAQDIEIDVLSANVSLYGEDGVKTGSIAKADFPGRVELVRQEADGRLHIKLDGQDVWVLGRHVQPKGADRRGPIICGGQSVAAVSVGGVRGGMEGCRK